MIRIGVRRPFIPIAFPATDIIRIVIPASLERDAVATLFCYPSQLAGDPLLQRVGENFPARVRWLLSVIVEPRLGIPEFIRGKVSGDRPDGYLRWSAHS